MTDETRRRCRLSLHHAHLPKLAAAELVAHEESDDQVRPTEALDEFAERL